MKTSLVTLFILVTSHGSVTSSVYDDDDVEDFVNYAVKLLKEDLKQSSGRTTKKRSANDNPGYYAMPLPYLPTDVRDNLPGIKMATNVNMDLVSKYS